MSVRAVSENAVPTQRRTSSDVVAYLRVGAGSCQFMSLLLNIQECCELSSKPWNSEIGNIYTKEISNHFRSELV